MINNFLSAHFYGGIKCKVGKMEEVQLAGHSGGRDIIYPGECPLNSYELRSRRLVAAVS